MPEYKYYWDDPRTKQRMVGMMEAKNESTARAMLRNQGIRVKRIHDAAKPPWIPFEKGPDGKTVFNPPPFLMPSVGLEDIVMFCKQFSVMIDAGLPLTEGLQILSGQGDNPTFNYQLRMIADNIEGGNTLAESMEKFPKSFDRLFTSMVHAGEEGGILDAILKKLSEFLEKNLKLQKTLKGAMVYPVIVLAISFIVIVVLLVFVIPVFEKMFKEMGNELPALTQAIIDASKFVQNNFAALFVVTTASIIGVMSFVKSQTGSRLIDQWILKVPVIGEVVRAVSIARFCGTMSTMLGAGVAIVDCLEICSKTAGNYTLECEILGMRSAVMEGATITGVLEGSVLFPKLVTSMIGVGEEAGNLDSMLEKIAIYYEEVVDEAVKSMTSMIEPIMIVFLGGIIGTLVVAMYLPIFSMASNI